jgi:hypothetical protein
VGIAGSLRGHARGGDDRAAGVGPVPCLDHDVGARASIRGGRPTGSTTTCERGHLGGAAGTPLSVRPHVGV